MRRAALRGLAAIVVLGAVLGLRSPDPSIADPAAAMAQTAAARGNRDAALVALERLRMALSTALGSGRTGAAMTVDGATRPGPQLVSAADELTAAEPLVDDATAALRRLAGDLAILRAGSVAPSLDVQPGELAGAGAELAATADSADAFWSMRLATQATLARLADALGALEQKNAAEALAALDAADEQLAAVRAWPGQLATLPVWVDTSGQLLAATRRVAVAMRDGDGRAAVAAARDYAAAASRAHQADVALAIAVAEGGGSISAAALRSAADALDATDAAIATVGSILA